MELQIYNFFFTNNTLVHFNIYILCLFAGSCTFGGMKTERIGKYLALYTFDDGEYIISSLGEGGYIGSNKDLKALKEDFEKAMVVCEAVYKLQYFNGNGKFPTEEELEKLRG